jgi:hypothetical protein
VNECCDVPRQRSLPNWSRLVLVLSVLSGVVVACGPARRHEVHNFTSIASAREQLPVSCRPVLYALNGILQPDSVRIYQLPSDSIARIALVHGSGVSQCRIIAVETKD